jgi:hypothetical protein
VLYRLSYMGRVCCSRTIPVVGGEGFEPPKSSDN